VSVRRQWRSSSEKLRSSTGTTATTRQQLRWRWLRGDFEQAPSRGRGTGPPWRHDYRRPQTTTTI